MVHLYGGSYDTGPVCGQKCPYDSRKGGFVGEPIIRPPIVRSYSAFYTLLRKCDRDVPDDEVWKNPVQQLAKKYGASDVGLAKAWRKLGVPLPGLGYWAKKTANGRLCKYK